MMEFANRRQNLMPEGVSMIRKNAFAGKVALLCILALAVADSGPSSSATKAGSPAASAAISIYGVWHAGNDACTWASVRNMVEFDSKNHWLIDRGDGLPSVNLVILSFVNPLKLLNKTTDSATSQGIPVGMTQEVVNYFKTRNVRVMLSIGGITYTGDWNTALASNPAQLGRNAAEA